LNKLAGSCPSAERRCRSAIVEEGHATGSTFFGGRPSVTFNRISDSSVAMTTFLFTGLAALCTRCRPHSGQSPDHQDSHLYSN
jgi:hypothetical protein